IIDFPLIGGVELLAKRPEQVEDDIRTRLAAGFLVEPKVTVFVKERNSQKVHVLGQVNKPGSFNYETGMTVIQAITNAGGFTKLASRNGVQLTRVSSGKEERFRVPVGDIGEGTSRNIELQPGDIVFVPEAIF
ncbi:MAG: polysaccharide biosynthesis/export family protein, partial [Myxococcota bacterium]